jgi:hypothetical protein
VNGDRNLAVFCDFENIALGARDAKYASFDMQLVLQKLLLKGGQHRVEESVLRLGSLQRVQGHNA